MIFHRPAVAPGFLLRSCPMTPRQLRFVDEYLIDLNGGRAAIRAGYSAVSAMSRAAIFLRQPDIAAAIERAMATRSLRTGITPARVLEEYARIAFADARLLREWGPHGVAVKDASALSDAASALIAAIEAPRHGGGIRIALHDKNKALATLARILGLENEAPAGHA
jgi:phage terminase small subunit